MFCLNNKIHFSLANANNSGSFKRKLVLNHRFCSFTTTNKLVNEAANASARVNGQDHKKTARNQSDCRISRIPPPRKLRKKIIQYIFVFFGSFKTWKDVESRLLSDILQKAVHTYLFYEVVCLFVLHKIRYWISTTFNISTKGVEILCSCCPFFSIISTIVVSTVLILACMSC